MLWLSRKDIEHISRRLLRDYLKKVPQKVDHIDPTDFAEKMCGLQFTFADISEAHDAIGLTATSGVIITIPQRDGTRLDYELDGKTAFIDQSLVAENQIGRLNFTMMHEAAHQLFWMLYPEEYEVQTPRCVFRMADREDGAVMGNRKQPFGYKMALGEIVIQEAEAKLVQEIFRRYIAGESLNELTEALRQQDIPYDEGRLWNKNMVARILADIRYTGEKGYPKLIDEDQLIAANEKRSNKPQPPKKTEAQKVLRRLCGTPPSERVEQSVTGLLNGLANYPERIQHQRSPTPATHSKTQEALDNALEQQPIDEDNAKTLILRLAAEQYAALGNEEYETNRLRRLFSAFECVAELNADLLKSTVSEVLVTRQNVKLRLKNGQVIERSDLQ